MEGKIKHRILGILVIIGLVIILLPLFQHGNETPKEAKLIKAPPFPDQAIQVSTPEPNTPSTTQQIEPAKEIQSSMKDQPDDTISVLRPSIINSIEPAHSSSEAMQPDDSQSVVKTTELSSPPIELDQKEAEAADPDSTIPSAQPDEPKTLDMLTEEPVKKTKVTKPKPFKERKKPVSLVKKERHKQTKIAIKKLNDNGLVELKNPAWVIQIGSFKNKANALRLVNQLRANGYRAFIQHVSTTGENTRVFVGPENKRKSARDLATKIENDMHIKGIVISYQPLAL